ncbi:NB-ARC domain-containing protein [Actinomadura madurae]|uniref:NB-ARC domain-containing protein n=1 Tax=Actinomadura madurae TaxID=1993 RepID=UPI00202754C0|nr:NB-ARC domain-containing protein [Actinomadura madurae]URN03151.1 NB-ARC domain-containing protein [Actinomadura madurae]
MADRSDRHPSEGKLVSGAYSGLLTVDVAGFGRDRTETDQARVRAALYTMIRASFEAGGVPFDDCHVEDRGDGAIVVLPPGVPVARLLHPIVDDLCAEIRAHNRASSPSTSMQLRVAVHSGPVYQDEHGLLGAAVVHVFRLLDAREVKERLTGSDASAILVVSDRVHEEVVAQGWGNVAPHAYTAIMVGNKETTARAWVRLPDETPDRDPLESNAEQRTSSTGWERHAVVDHDRLFGVDALIDTVTAAVMSPSANWIVSLFGDGGIGKTTIAYEAAARCAAAGGFAKVAWASATNISLSMLDRADAARGTAYWLDLIRDIAAQFGIELGMSRALWERDLAHGVAAMPADERALTVIDNLESTEDAEGILSRLEGLGLIRPHKVIVTTRWSVQRDLMAITEFLLSGLRPEDALAFVRHLGSADPDLREADREVLAPVLTVTEGNPFLIKLVIRQYLATRRSLDRVMADLTGLGAGDTGPGLGRRVREHLYVRSLAQLADRCGEEVAASLMGAFCVKDRGTSFEYEELMTISGIDDPALFEQALEFACRLALVRSSDFNRAYSIHSLLHEFTCRS